MAGKKTPDCWPAAFHAAMVLAAMFDDAIAAVCDTKEGAEASARSMRELWKCLRGHPLHANAGLLEHRQFRNELIPTKDGEWLHRIYTNPLPVVLPRG